MVKVVEYLQGVYGFKSQADCQWVLLPPSDVNGFVSRNIWALRLGATSVVREVENQRLNAVSFEEAQDKYTQVAGELAVDTLRVAHKDQNRGQGVTKPNMLMLLWPSWRRRTRLSRCIHNSWTKPQTFTSKTGSKTNVYANRSSSQMFDYYHWCVYQSVVTRHVMGPKKIPRACGLVNYLSTVSRCSSWHFHLHSCPVWVNNLAVGFRCWRHGTKKKAHRNRHVMSDMN